MKPGDTQTERRVHRFPVTPRVLWALACQTLRQCLRRKVLLVLLFFVGVVLVGHQVMPAHDPVKRLEMLVVWCLHSMWFFGIIVAIFLAATVLPEDRTRGTITTVMTKPVGRLNYLLGRIVGFAMTLGIILAVMGVVSWGFIRWRGAALGGKAPGEVVLTAKRGIDPTRVFLLEPGQPKMTLAPEAASAVLRGRVERKLVFHFRSHLGRLPEGNQTFEMTPYVWTGAKLPNTPAEVVVTNPLTGERLPLEVTLDSDRTLAVTFPRSLVDAKAGVEVSVRRLSPGAYVRAARGTFQLMRPAMPFEYSYVKSLLMIFFSFLLVVVISITASTFLSGWVAVLVAFVAYFFAAMQEVLLDFMQGLKGEAVGLVGAHAFRHVHHGMAPEHVADPWYVIVVNRVFYGVLWVFTHIFPNFDRFDAAPYLVSARDVPAAVVGMATLIFLGYAVCYLILGHIVFWRRELVP